MEKGLWWRLSPGFPTSAYPHPLCLSALSRYGYRYRCISLERALMALQSGGSPDSLSTTDSPSSATAQRNSRGRAYPFTGGTREESSTQGGGVAPWIAGVVASVKDFVVRPALVVELEMAVMQ